MVILAIFLSKLFAECYMTNNLVYSEADVKRKLAA